MSRLAASEVASDYGVPEDQLTVVYNGVDGERFNPGRRPELGPALREELGIDRDVPLCAAVGSGFQRKGFDILLALWKRSPPPRREPGSRRRRRATAAPGGDRLPSRRWRGASW